MKRLNPYYRSAKISEPKTRQIIEYFALDLTAKKNKPGSLLILPLTALLQKQHNKLFLNVYQKPVSKPQMFGVSGDSVPVCFAQSLLGRKFFERFKSADLAVKINAERFVAAAFKSFFE